MSEIIYRTPSPWGHCEEPILQFRLTYEGPLYASQPSKQYCPKDDCPLKQSKAKTLATHKQEIRKHFHKQIKMLWQRHPILSEYEYCTKCGLDPRPLCKPEVLTLGSHEYAPITQYLTDNHKVGPYN